MKISDIAGKLNLKVIAGEGGLENEITGGYTSDLLSDVIGNAKEGNIWITLQTHHNVMAVAMLKDLSAVIIVRGLKASEEAIKKGNEENIPVLSSTDDSFTVTGRLYKLLEME
ncbi:MAG TPA: DRTGG domain-containing protein [Bacteroidales bacterium]|nr:DRTGG domain-containing protein [Bacteroidales bacterium]